uniref:Ribosomal protein S4 n=1 Tax=Porolithon onkodes TaxID=231751 RepID=A0A2Z2KS99_9FLOR|nr:ribosomal protein S4 [Porolithon onkodes]ASB29786.1 ribosomal protein S4 [Porolithon onkodes]
MSRYRGPRLKIYRKLGELPGLTRKTSKKMIAPGEHGQKSKKPSDYALRLDEKQKLRFNYGISEKQLLNYMKIAKKAQGPTGSVLMQILEMRLDNTIFRLGIAPTIPAARQLINHGHIKVNENRLNICSYQCKPGDIVKVNENNKSKNLVEKYLNNPGLTNIPNHLEFNQEHLTGRVNSIVERDWIALKINELLIVEYYSRK